MAEKNRGFWLRGSVNRLTKNPRSLEFAVLNSFLITANNRKGER